MSDARGTASEHDLLGPYLLDALAEEERNDFVHHLETCPLCQLREKRWRPVLPYLPQIFAVVVPEPETVQEIVLGEVPIAPVIEPPSDALELPFPDVPTVAELEAQASLSTEPADSSESSLQDEVSNAEPAQILDDVIDVELPLPEEPIAKTTAEAPVDDEITDLIAPEVEADLPAGVQPLTEAPTEEAIAASPQPTRATVPPNIKAAAKPAEEVEQSAKGTKRRLRKPSISKPEKSKIDAASAEKSTTSKSEISAGEGVASVAIPAAATTTAKPKMKVRRPVTETASASEEKQGWNWKKIGLGLLCAAAIASIVWGLVQAQKVSDLEQEIDFLNGKVSTMEAQQQNALELIPAITYDLQATTAGISGSSGTVFASPSSNLAVLAVQGMAALPEGSVYQVWLVGSDGNASPGPTFAVDGTGSATVSLDVQLTDYQGIAITQEPTGGSQAPTTQVVMQSLVAS